MICLGALNESFSSWISLDSRRMCSTVICRSLGALFLTWVARGRRCSVARALAPNSAMAASALLLWAPQAACVREGGGQFKGVGCVRERSGGTCACARVHARTRTRSHSGAAQLYNAALRLLYCSTQAALLCPSWCGVCAVPRGTRRHASMHARCAVHSSCGIAQRVSCLGPPAARLTNS